MDVNDRVEVFLLDLHELSSNDDNKLFEIDPFRCVLEG